MTGYKWALNLSQVLLIWNNLALSQQIAGRNDEAEASYINAIELRPDFFMPYFNLGRLMQSIGKHQRAVGYYRKAVQLEPDHAQASFNLGLAAEKIGDLKTASESYLRVTTVDATSVAAQRNLADVLGRAVPLWHVPMMNDTARNKSYWAALSALMMPGDRVLEIGTGSGLLAMMAAQAGAAEVVTCEAEPIIADAAKTIIDQNGYGSRVRLIPKKSTDLDLCADRLTPADVLVFEIFSSELLGEHVLSTIEDAKPRLAKPGCRVVPAQASIMIALCGGEAIGKNLFVDNVSGFDLTPLNGLVSRRQPLGREDLQLELLSLPVRAFSFDFAAESAWIADSKLLEIPVQSSGRCYGVVQWIQLVMDDENVFENSPDTLATAASWTRTAYLLPAPVDVEMGQTAVGVSEICRWRSRKR